MSIQLSETDYTQLSRNWTQADREKIRRIFAYFISLAMIGGGVYLFWPLDRFRQDHRLTWLGAYYIFRTHPRLTADVSTMLLFGVIVAGAILAYQVLNYVPDEK